MNRFILLFILFLFFCYQSQSQYIVAGKYNPTDYFFDVVPDAVISPYYPNTNVTNQIDINGDGVNDFSLTASYGSERNGTQKYCALFSNGNNSVAFGHQDSCFSSTFKYVSQKGMGFAFKEGDTIDNKAVWIPNVNLAYYDWVGGSYQCQSNAFQDTVPLYLGVRHLLFNDTLYGWIKVRSVSSAAVTLLEYACNLGTTAIRDFSGNCPIKLYPNPIDKQFTLEYGGNEINKNTLMIYNYCMQQVFEKKIEPKINFIDVSQIKNGIYLIMVRNNQGVLFSKKIAIVHI